MTAMRSPLAVPSTTTPVVEVPGVVGAPASSVPISRNGGPVEVIRYTAPVVNGKHITRPIRLILVGAITSNTPAQPAGISAILEYSGVYGTNKLRVKVPCDVELNCSSLVVTANVIRTPFTVPGLGFTIAGDVVGTVGGMVTEEPPTTHRPTMALSQPFTMTSAMMKNAFPISGKDNSNTLVTSAAFSNKSASAGTWAILCDMDPTFAAPAVPDVMGIWLPPSESRIIDFSDQPLGFLHGVTVGVVTDPASGSAPDNIDFSNIVFQLFGYAPGVY